MAKGKSTGARKGGNGTSTLRSMRHAASSSSKPKAEKKVRSTASLTVAERIAKRAQKPLIKGRQFKFVSPADRLAAMKVDLDAVRNRREMLEGEDEAEDDSMHSLFGHALQQSQLINLSLPFVRFSKKVEKWSRSLPLVVHFRKELVEAVCEAFSAGSHDVEMLGETVLDLLPPLITDLAHMLLPSLPLLLTTLIRLTAPSPLHSANPGLLQRIYDVLGALFRDVGRDILAAASGEEKGGLPDVWQVVRRGLGAPAPAEEEEQVEEAKMDVEEPAEEKPEESEDEDEDEEEEAPVASTSAQPIEAEAPTKLHSTLPSNFRTTPQTRRLLANSFAYLVRKAKPSSAVAGEEDQTMTLEELVELMVQDVASVEEIDGGERANGGRGAKGRRKGKGKGRGQEEGSSNVFAEGLTWLTVESCAAANHFFHSRTPTILRAFFSATLSLSSLSLTALPSEIISHSLVALVQHANKAERGRGESWWRVSLGVVNTLSVLERSCKSVELLSWPAELKRGVQAMSSDQTRSSSRGRWSGGRKVMLRPQSGLRRRDGECVPLVYWRVPDDHSLD